MKKNIKLLVLYSAMINGFTALQSSEQEVKAGNILRENAKTIFGETASSSDDPINISYEVHRYVKRIAPIARDCDILIDNLRHYRNILYSRPFTNNSDSKIPHHKQLAINMPFFRNSSGDMTTTNPLLVQKRKVDLMTTPLHYAFDCYKKAQTKEQQLSTDENIRLLIEHGANVNARDYKTERPLHRAHKNTHIILLIQHGAFKDIRDGKGRTPLFKQLEEQRPFLAQCLLLMGAEMHKPDQLGNTVFHLAADMYPIGLIHFLSFHMLKQNNCIISSPNKNKIRPLDIAYRKKNLKMASLIKNIIMSLFCQAIDQQQLNRVKKLWRENSDWLRVHIPSLLSSGDKNRCMRYLKEVCKEE